MWATYTFPFQPHKSAAARGLGQSLEHVWSSSCYWGGLFTLPHPVAADHITWPGGDSYLLGSHPAALEVQRGARGRKEMSNLPLFSFFPPPLSFSCYPSIYLPLSVSHCLSTSLFFHFFATVSISPFRCFFVLPPIACLPSPVPLVLVPSVHIFILSLFLHTNVCPLCITHALSSY